MMIDDLKWILDNVWSVTGGDPLERKWTSTVSNIDISSLSEPFFYETKITTMMKPTKCVLNPPATILFWPDKTKTVVKCQNGDPWDPEKGIALAMLKKYFGNTGKYNDIIRDLIPKEK